MKIREIAQASLRSSVLTLEQEAEIERLLLQKQYTATDLEALEQLLEALEKRCVRAEVRTTMIL
jgi:hypothetical protein